MSHPGRTVRVTASVVGAVYAAVLYLSGFKLNSDVKHVLAYLPTLFVWAVVAYDKWVWRWPVVSSFHKRPRIGGLWRVELRPAAESHIPAGGNRGPIEGYMVIEQTYWSNSLTQFTNESSSYSKTAVFVRHGDTGKQCLVFVYGNEPRREFLSRSPRNTGGCELDVATGAPTTVSDFYFTDRFTSGDLDLELIDRSVNFSSFAQAKEHAEAVRQ